MFFSLMRLTFQITGPLNNFISYYTNSSHIVDQCPEGQLEAEAGTAILLTDVYHIDISTTSITNTAIYINLENRELRLVAVYKSPS